MLRQLVSKNEQCGSLSDIKGNPIHDFFQYIFQTRPEQLERTPQVAFQSFKYNYHHNNKFIK